MSANIKNANINWWKIIFIIFVAAYASLMLIKPDLAPTDDVMLLRTLQDGKFLLYYSPGLIYGDMAKDGRFEILNPMEYNIFGFFSKSPSAFWYFLVHAFQYVLFMILFVKILSRFTSNKILIYLTPILLSLTPMMTIPFFRTHLNERNVIFYYAIFLFCYFLYLEQGKLRHLIWGVISANMAMYYKETGFTVLVAFAFCHLFLTWKKSQPKADEPPAQKLGANPIREVDFLKTSDKSAPSLNNNPQMKSSIFSNGTKIFDGLIMLSSFTYLLLYYLIIFRHLDPNVHLYNHTALNHLPGFIKLLLNYGFFSDPILILILLPFTAWRTYKALRRQLELHPIYDSMLIAGSMYVISLFVLKIPGLHYLLPAYVFALPPLIYFFSQREQRTLLWKGAAAVCGVALLFNVFPAGIHYLTYYKYLSVNFNKTLDFLIGDINSRYPNKRANILLDGINPSTGVGTYFTFTEFLHYKGLSSERFDFKSNVKTEDSFIILSAGQIKINNSHRPFTIFQNHESFEISKGDYLIVPAESTTKNITKTYIQSLAKDYDLLFKAESPLAFPDLNLKTLAKYLLLKKSKEKGIMINENLMQWPNYYVFIRK